MEQSGAGPGSPEAASIKSKGKEPSPLRNEQLLVRGRTGSDPAEQLRAKPSSRRVRTVSDAAQYARNRRQSELMKELMPAGKGGASAHKFQLTTYSKATFCGVCSKFLWGFSRQGLKCIDCGFDCHKQCQQFAPACLGKHGSVASTELDGFVPARTGTWKVQITICSADGLARKSMFKTPDPFCLATMSSGQQFCTQPARKTLSPQWNYSDRIVVTPSEQLTLTVFDAKKYSVGSMEGFLGVCIIPANVLLDTGSLGQGATGVVTFRLKKIRENDSVTGKLVLKIDRMERVPEVRQTAAAPIDIPGATEGGKLARHLSESPLMLSTSPGSGWQKLLPEHIPDTPRKSLLPNQPLPPICEIISESQGTVMVTWDDGGVTGRETGVSFSLAIIDGMGRQHGIYTGHEPRHRAVGFAPGEEVQFCVKAFNFFGSSEYSVPSEKITLPTVKQEDEDTRQHCPMFMAGLCFRGAQCPFSHGTGLQSADDVAAALMAASVIADPDVQMAAALAASMTDYSRPNFDPTGLPQYKREFHSKVSRLRTKVSVGSSACSFPVSRPELFKSSFFEISRRKPSELKGQLQIQFLGEGGLDYGGLAREWFNLVSLEIFNPKLGMFEYTRDEDYSLTIDPNSAMEPDHMLYFQFVGRFMGLAVLHGHFIDANFTSVFCKRLLAAPITISDLQEEDPSLHRSMLWILENDVSGVPDMTFSADYESFGEYKTHDLVPGGQDIEVTETNKHKFIELMVAWRLSRGTDKQLIALLNGLHEIIPRSELQEFNERELQFLLCGTREVDVDDWKSNCIYEGCTAQSAVVQYFWQIVEEYSAGEKSSLLQFCTGSTRIPIEGFQSLQGSDGPRKFCIQFVNDLSRLPSAHTCFNRLDLPGYSTKEVLKRQLRLAIDGTEGFGGD